MSGNQPDTKKITAGNLAVAVAVIGVIQVLGLLITKQNSPVYGGIVNSTGYSYAPLGATPAGSAGNAALLVVLAGALTFALVWLLRHRMVLSFKAIVFGSLAISTFVLTLVTAAVFSENYLTPDQQLEFGLVVASAIVVLIGYTIFVKNRPWLSTIILAFVGAEVGSFLAETLSPWTALILPLAFSLYDIYAVFRGPLKQLIGTAPNIALVGMSIKAGEFTLGLGDVVFYTMLPALALFQFGLSSALATIVAIDFGVIVTLFLLSRRRLLPGLPIPMLLGVGTLVLMLV